MIDIAKEVVKRYEKEKRNYPCKSNRASSIGYFVPELSGCLRRGVYERTRWEDKEPYDAETLMIFEEGNRQERAVLKDLAEAGIDIIEQQQAFEWKSENITGHIDGVYVDGRETIPVEIKSMNPNIFQQMNSLDDFYKKPWTTAYLAQITLYMMHKNCEHGIFVLKDKSSGKIKQINVDLNYDLGESCLKTAENINYHVDKGTLPERIDDRQKCKNCPFKLICLPDMAWGEPLKIKDDPAAEKKIDKYLELEEAKKEAISLWKEISGELKAEANGGELNIILGKYRITGKTAANGSFRPKVELV